MVEKSLKSPLQRKYKSIITKQVVRKYTWMNKLYLQVERVGYPFIKQFVLYNVIRNDTRALLVKSKENHGAFGEVRTGSSSEEHVVYRTRLI